MDDGKINLESLLLSYYIKYNRLDGMIYTSGIANTAIPDVNNSMIDVYIDIYDYLKPIYTKEIYANKKFLIVSSLVNLAAHIRGYFGRKHGIYTRIFLVYGESITDQHKVFWPSFGDDDFRQTLNYEKNNSFIKSQLQLLQIICAYIPEVYYVNRTSDFSMFVFDNMMKNPNTLSIIITKSKYAYQIPALLSNAKLFRPKKYQGEDTSYVVSKPYVYGNLYHNINSDVTLGMLSKINPNLCSVMMSLTGLSSYKVRNLLNVKSAVKMLYDAIYTGKIANDYNSDTDYLYSNLYGLDEKIDPTSFKSRFNAIDLVYQHRIYNSTAEARDITWLIDLNDPETVRSINNKYFIDNPLDLNSL